MATVGILLQNADLTFPELLFLNFFFLPVLRLYATRWTSFPELCRVIADVLTSLKTYGPEGNLNSPNRVLYCDISVLNIIVSIRKGDQIMLDNECFVRARQDTC